MDDVGIVRLADPVKKKLGYCDLTLEYKVYLLVDVLQRSIEVLTVADTMASHTSLTGVLLAFDQHRDSF
jgi:hypothetical protein